MKTFFLLLIVIIISNQLAFGQKKFEGKVTYKISYEIIHPNATIEFLEDNYGVKEIFYYRKGFYKRIYLNKNNDTIKTIVYNPKEKTVYGTHISVKDTIMKYSSTDNIMKSYETEEVDRLSILELDVYGVLYKFNFKEDEILSGPSKSEITYYFSDNFPIKSKWHKNQKDGFYNEIIKRNPFLILKMINNDFWIKIETKEVVSIELMKVDKNMFNIDKDFPIKEI